MKTLLLAIYVIFIVMPLNIAVFLPYLAIKVIFVLMRMSYDFFILLPWIESEKISDSILVNTEKHLRSLSAGFKK
jgi:hypothetical protein